MTEQILDALLSIGADIQTVVRNYKKDPGFRKTSVEYYQERLNRIQGLLSNFKILNSKIKAQEIPDDHEYMKSDYFNSILNLGTEFQGLFEQELRKLEKPSTSKAGTLPTNNQASQPIAQQRAQDNPIPTSEGIVRRFTAKMADLERFVAGMGDTIQYQQPQYVQVKKDSLQGIWQQLQELHDSIWDKFEDPIAAGADIPKYIDLETKVQDILIQLSTHTGEATIIAPTANTSPMSNITQIGNSTFSQMEPIL